MKHIRYHQLILLLLTLTLFACGGKKSADSANADSQNGLVTFHLNAPPSKVEPLLLSELADSVSYVALETTKETLTTGGVQYGDRYYTIINEDRLLCFDKSGKYLHKIGRQGQGPGEYPFMFDYSYFQVDPTNNWVYVTSNNCKLVYDENGKYIKSLTGEMWRFTPYFVYNDLAYFAPYFSRFEIIDGSTNQIVRNNKRLREEMKTFLNELSDKAKKEGKKEYISEGIAPVLSIYNDAVYYWCILLNDTVIMAKGKEVKPHCRIIPENKYKPEEMYGGNKNSKLLQPIIMKMYIFKDKILLFVHYYASIDDNSDNGYWVLCDFISGNVTYHSNYIINDLDGGPNILVPNSGIEDIYCLSVEDLKNDEEIYNSYFTEGVEAKLKDQEGKFQRLLKSLADDANPIIRTIHWKE